MAVTALMLPSTAFAQAGHTHTERPNIILFMVDDMGWQDTSLPFWNQRTFYNDRYETPNMERLAAQGMMFTQAYDREQRRKASSDQLDVGKEQIY